MRAKATNEGVFSGEGLEGPVNLAGEFNGKTTPGAPPDHASPGNAMIGPARALWIYVKHRGLMNVDEFRRTNARGL